MNITHPTFSSQASTAEWQRLSSFSARVIFVSCCVEEARKGKTKRTPIDLRTGPDQNNTLRLHISTRLFAASRKASRIDWGYGRHHWFSGSSRQRRTRAGIKGVCASPIPPKEEPPNESDSSPRLKRMSEAVIRQRSNVSTAVNTAGSASSTDATTAQLVLVGSQAPRRQLLEPQGAPGEILPIQAGATQASPFSPAVEVLEDSASHDVRMPPGDVNDHVFECMEKVVKSLDPETTKLMADEGKALHRNIFALKRAQESIKKLEGNQHYDVQRIPASMPKHGVAFETPALNNSAREAGNIES